MKRTSKFHTDLLIIFSLVFAMSFILGFYSANQNAGLADSVAQDLIQSAAPKPTFPAFSPEPKVTSSPIPMQKKLAGGTHVFQTFNNCGPASLSMALSYYQITATQQTLGQALRPFQNPQGDNDDKSVTLQELANKAEEYELIAYHRPAGSIELVQAFVANDIPVITRTWLKPGEDIGHYRVVVGYDQVEQVLIQDDSLQGNDARYSYAEFNELWQAFNYEFVVLVPPDKQAQAEAILGSLLDRRASWEEAGTLAVAQLQKDPSDIYARFNLSVAHYQLGDFSASVREFESVGARLPSRMLWYQIDPILAYYKNGEFDTVLAITQKILDNNNRAFSELHYLRGLIFSQRNQNNQATEAFDLAERYNQSEYWPSNLDGLTRE